MRGWVHLRFLIVFVGGSNWKHWLNHDMAAHSWETLGSSHSWERLPGGDLGDFWGECSDDEYTEVADTAGSELVKLIVEHNLTGRLSAKQCCTLLGGKSRCQGS